MRRSSLSSVTAAFVYLLLTSALPNSARAQITWDGCVDSRGTPVASIRDVTITDVAYATMENGMPVIRYNRLVLASISSSSRLFWYLHECAHHALGHNGLPGQEREADCWAGAKLRQLKGMTIERVSNLAAEFSGNRGDWSHLPGPMRVLDILSCAGGASEPSPAPQRRVPCSHHVPCSHQTACGHFTQQCGCVHMFDVMPNGWQTPCAHCGCRTVQAHASDQEHPFDTLHAYDLL